MKKLYLLLGVFALFIFAGSARATPCYQEFANQSETCGAVAGGGYSTSGGWSGCIPNLYDGNWSWGCYGYTNSWLYPTYVIPSDINKSNTTWKVDCSDLIFNDGESNYFTFTSHNYSFTIPDVCMNDSSGNLSLQWWTPQYWSGNTSTIYCFSYDSNWINIAELGNSTEDCSDPVEEAIIWDIAEAPINETYNLTWFSPINNSLINITNSIIWGLTAEETPIYCYLSINGTGNISMSTDGVNCSYTSTSLANGTYCGQVTASDGDETNTSYVQCSTILFSSPSAPPLINNLGAFGFIGAIAIGAGILMFLIDAFLGSATEILRDPKKLVTIIIGAIIMVAVVSVLF